jgi:hypothetical protein
MTRFARVGGRALVVALAAASSHGVFASEASPRITATPVTARITIDGRLDEPAWAGAPAIRLTQQDPHPGEATPFTTELRVLASAETLYFGFHCVDPAPGNILVHTWERDADQDEDDRVAIVLDTFRDGRTGYWFRMNAAGARQDGLVSGPTEASADWDGIWSGRTARTADGWSAEIEIPARTLQFRGGDAWGFNALRFVARERTALRWTALSLDASFLDVSRTGLLEGLGALHQGHGLSLAPYGLARAARDRETDSSSTTGDVGGEVRDQITPQLAGVLTFNTDFAETEVDDRVVNLTRFSFFFPEKRPFFLEGSNLFSFGLGLEEKFLPFYSRRVGLSEGVPVPIDGGAKLLGRAGRWSIAALDVETESSPAGPATNLFAGRVALDAGAGWRLGWVGTSGGGEGGSEAKLVGGDAVWQTSRLGGDKNGAFGVWGARSDGEASDGDHSGWGAIVSYPNDSWDVSLSVNQFGGALDPALGFVNLANTRQWDSGVAYQPRPRVDGRFGWARQFFYESFFHRIERLGGELETWRLFFAPWNVTTQSGARIELDWQPEFERLLEPFEIASGVVIPPGEYRFNRVRVELGTAQTRNWRLATSDWFGDFYGGRLSQFELDGSYTPLGGRLRVEASGEIDQGTLPSGDFTIRLYKLRALWAFTPDLVLSSLVQYDSESRSLGANTRLRWTIRPGSDLFVVWTRGYLRDTEGGDWRLRPQRDEVVLKLRWTFQL